MSPMSKKRIAVDIDDVLAAYAEGFVAFSNERWGTNLTVEDYDEHWAAMWQTDHEETERRAQLINESGIHGRFRHDDTAAAVLRRLKERFDLVVVTARLISNKAVTAVWVERYFEGIFSEVRHAGIWEQDVPDRHTLTKVDVLREVGVDYLVDDQPKHCLAAAEAGMPTILFGDYAWNRNVEVPDGVTRCRDWGEVEEYFEHR